MGQVLSAKSIVISYFVANGREWVSTWYTPYNRAFVTGIRAIPKARYDIHDKSWACEAKYGAQVEELVRTHFPDIPLNVHDHRANGDLYG